MYKYTFPFSGALKAKSLLHLTLFLLLVGCGTGVGSLNQGTLTPAASVALSTPQIEKTATGVGPSNTSTQLTAGGYDCRSVNQIPLAECEALVALYTGTNGSGWVENTGWLDTNIPCTWLGIECSGDHVTHLTLTYNQLNGTLPPELGDLPLLRVLALWGNQLDGPIPVELGNLEELVSLEMSSNQLEGPLPAELGNLRNLHTLNLAYNRLDGSIPPALARAKKLASLNLSHNQLRGSIPAELGDLKDLYNLDLSYNRLNGPVPDSLANIFQKTLWGNQLEGTISIVDPAPVSIDFMGVQFSVDPSLAASIWPELIPAAPYLEGAPFWYATPQHIRFTFADPNLSAGRRQMGINLATEAQVFIYPQAGLVEIEPWGQERVEALSSLLAARGPLPSGDLPLLPVANSAQVFHAQGQYLDSNDLQGLRFITQHTQEAFPVINNQDLFYTFQGFSNDGACYIAAFFPLSASVLPNQVERDDLGDFESYLLETTASLDQLTPAEFSPDLTLLDSVITSMRLESKEGLCAEISAIQ